MQEKTKQVTFEEYAPYNVDTSKEVVVRFSYTNINYTESTGMDASKAIYVDFEYDYEVSLENTDREMVTLPDYVLEEDLVVHYTGMHKQELVDRWLLKNTGEESLCHTDLEGLDEWGTYEEATFAGIGEGFSGTEFDHSQIDS